MRHAKKFNHLGRKTAHRKAMLSNMSNSLIENKRIFTTVAKAKALRMYLEPLLTKSKTNTTHNRRQVFSKLKNKYAVTELFDTVAPKIAERPGGYLRIIKTGFRPGDGAEMAMIELVDFNEVYTQAKEGAGTKKKRSRRGGKKNKTEETKATEEIVESATEAAEEATESVEEATEEVTTKVEDSAEEVVETVEEAAEEVVEEVKEEVEEAKEDAAEETTEDADATEEGGEEKKED